MNMATQPRAESTNPVNSPPNRETINAGIPVTGCWFQVTLSAPNIASIPAINEKGRKNVKLPMNMSLNKDPPLKRLTTKYQSKSFWILA